MLDVEPADFSKACPSKVVRPNAVRLEISHRVGPCDKIVVVEMKALIVLEVGKAYLLRISGKEKILAVEIGDPNLLSSPVKSIQTAVGIFLQSIEIGEIELIPIGFEVAEEAHP